MDTRLNDIVNGKWNNHLLPFLWMHEGHHDELRSLVDGVYDSGARAFCVESRPHEGFGRETWWSDMAEVLDEAEKLGMKVWILDDKHFPTGYANGLIAEKYSHLRRRQLIEDHLDVVGPAPDSAMLLRIDPLDDKCDDKLIGVYAFRRTEHDEILSGDPVDLTANVKDGYVFWDVPQGVYRIVALYESLSGNGSFDYVHNINPESVHVLIEAVYETHYAHFGKYFGGTIAGFFSDEPSFGNTQTCGANRHTGYEQTVGQPGLALPWTEEVLRRMTGELGRDAAGLLPALWYGYNGLEASVRVAYMNAVTNLWKEAFSYQLGDWCRAHGVMYIGHIIEDENAHMRLGCSAGHYFRALDGQDMAGIDVVLHQVIPGLAHNVHAASVWNRYADPEFFEYVLGRLAASHCHIRPRMKGRAMCEIFGAYGWAEGLPFMRRLMDHMLVRGLNYFVPHAFSPKFPDPDCPPHFNAGGHNPQFDGFTKLMEYTNKVTHLLDGAHEIVDAAILYNAEAEWAGKGCMLPQKPAQALYDEQLNYDFLPSDTLIEKASVKDGALCVEAMRYPVLIVPTSAFLPERLLVQLAKLEADGLKLVFIDERPEGCTCGKVISLEECSGFVRGSGESAVRPKTAFPMLRTLRMKRGSTDIFMLVNDSSEHDFEDIVRLPVSGKGIKADLLNDGYSTVTVTDGALPLRLVRGESTILVFDGTDPGFPAYEEPVPVREPKLEWTFSKKAAENEAGFSMPEPLDHLYNITGPEGDPAFSGTMRYETRIVFENGERYLDLGAVGECARVWLNGREIGTRIAAPYRFDISGFAVEGGNDLTVEVVNNLVHSHPEIFSRFMQIGPSGLIGPVRVLR